MSAAPPSPFAVLLRRSKFASYDPCIGQVYTTYGGHAHRGNWGFKRPLPNKRRVGFITVRAVDSPEQQTEWNSAEASARWMKRWQEQGKSLNSYESGVWYRIARKFTHSDSEFDRAGKHDTEPVTTEGQASVLDLPDLDPMTEKQFRKYLKRMQALRPEFKKHLYEYATSPPPIENKSDGDSGKKLKSEKMGAPDTLKLTGSGDVNMYASAAIGHDVHAKRFLAKLRQLELYAPESKVLAGQPHHLAGLEYTRISNLQAQYLHKPVPGRDVMQDHAIYDRRKDVLPRNLHYIAAGGVIGTMPQEAAGSLVPTDFGTRESPRRHRERGVGHFRMTRALLADAPTVVGREPEGIANTKRGGQQPDAAKVYIKHIEFWPTAQENTNRSNPYPLGSPDYVAKGNLNSQLLIPNRIAELAGQARRLRPPNFAGSDDGNDKTIQTLDWIIKEKGEKIQ